MPRRSPNVDDLILAIHSAALAPDGWSRLGQLLMNVLSAQSGIGLRVGSAAHPEPWAVLIDFDPRAAQAYVDHWGRHDVWYDGALRTGRISAGLVSIGTQFSSEDELTSSAFFHDYLKPIDIGSMIQVCLAGSEPNDAFGRAALSLYRGIGKSPFSSRDVQLLSRLSPHLTVAARNYWMTQSLRLLSSARANALDALTAAVFALDRSGRVILVNCLGEEFIRWERWVRVSRGILAPASTVLAANRFTAAFNHVSSGVGSSLLVTDLMTGADAQVSMAPIPPNIDLGLFLAPPTALVWVIPTAPRTDTAHDIALLFGLTAAERRLLHRLIEGDDLREATAPLRISIHTARAQLKSVFRKTGRRSQGQLLMLAARLATLSSRRT